MVALFVVGGIAGLLSSVMAGFLGASVPLMIGIYFAVGLLFPVVGMVRIGFEEEEDALATTGDRLEDTYAQWAADPESTSLTAEEEDTQKSRVA